VRDAQFKALWEKIKRSRNSIKGSFDMELHLNYESIEPYPLEREERSHPGPLPRGEGVRTVTRLIARKEQVIDLLMRVTAVSVETMKIVKGMP
jgi:hypothetical protein